MTTHILTSSAILDAPANEVFATITDLTRLPEWNTAITAVIEQPDHLEIGAQWVVAIHALGQSWHSRSELEELDLAKRRFTYRSVTDDGNPSHAQWTWQVSDQPEGTRVTVTVELHPRTFWRRALLIRIRSRQLAHSELPDSLSALETATRGSSPRR